MIESAFADHEAAMKRACGGLSAAEQKRAADLLRKLGVHAQAMLRDPEKNRALSIKE